MLKNLFGYYDQSYYAARYKENGLEPYFSQIIYNLLKDANVCLDAGCGTGILLRFLSKQGVMAIGFDISDFAVRKTKQIKACATSLPFAKGKFDIVFVIHMIEHMSYFDAARFLKELFLVLKPGGKVFIVTPNGISPRKLLARGKWFQDPTHVHIFNPFTLKKLLEHMGFIQVRFAFRIPLVQRPKRWLRDLMLFVLTTTPFAYVRDAIHVVAFKPK